MSQQQRKGNKKHRDDASSSSSAPGGGKGKKKEKKTKVDEDDLLKMYKDFISQVLYYNQGGEYFVSTGEVNEESLVQIFAKERSLDASQRSIVQKLDKDVRNNCS